MELRSKILRVHGDNHVLVIFMGSLKNEGTIIDTGEKEVVSWRYVCCVEKVAAGMSGTICTKGEKRRHLIAVFMNFAFLADRLKGSVLNTCGAHGPCNDLQKEALDVLPWCYRNLCLQINHSISLIVYTPDSTHGS